MKGLYARARNGEIADFTNNGWYDLDALTFVDVVDGTAGDDSMPVGFTDTDGDIIDGADGDNDIILGYGGNDTIDGGNGNDSI